MPPAYQKSRIKMRTLLGNSLYRRLLLWAVALFTIASLILLRSGVPGPEAGSLASTDEVTPQITGSGQQQQPQQPQQPQQQQQQPQQQQPPPQQQPPQDTQQHEMSEEDSRLPRWIRYKQ